MIWRLVPVGVGNGSVTTLRHEAKLLRVESTAMLSLSQTRAGNATLVIVMDTNCLVNFFKHLRQCFITDSRLKVLGNSI